MNQSDNQAEQKQSSYVKRFSIIAGSTLEEAECFVASLKTLQTSLNNNSNNPEVLEQDLKGAMDQYVRLTMIYDIFKVFNPFKSSPSPSPQSQATALIKQEAPDIKPSQLLKLSSHKEKPKQETAAVTLSPKNKSNPMDTSNVTHSRRQDALPPVSNNQQARSEVKHASTRTTEGRQPLPTGSNSTRVRSPSQSRTRTRTPVKDQAPPRNKSHSDADITAEQFINQFEALLTSFANANQLARDFTWERLLVHSLPPEQKEWFNQNLKGNNLSWAAAKRLFLEEHGSSGMTHAMKPNPSLEKRAQPAKPDTSLNRKAQYAQALLTLEMQDNDDLKEFNEKFKRYSDSAGMTCDYSLLKRYVNSLTKRFRALAAPLLSMPELANNLSGLMEQVEKLEQPSPGLVEADEHCSHHRDNGTDFKSAWPTVAGPLKRRAVDSTFEAVEKRTKYQPVA